MYWHATYPEQFEHFVARGYTERCCPFGEWAKGRSPYYGFVLLIEDPQLVRRIEAVQERLRPFPFVLLPPAHFLHITLKPVGFWDEAKEWDDSLNRDDVERWAERAEALAVNRGPFVVQLRGVNSWANSAFIEVYDLQGGLAALLEALDARFIEEGRLRVPHLTAGYYAARAPNEPLVEAMSALRSFEVGELRVESFQLVSARVGEGLSFHPLEAVQTFRLRGSSPTGRALVQRFDRGEVMEPIDSAQRADDRGPEVAALPDAAATEGALPEPASQEAQDPDAEGASPELDDEEEMLRRGQAYLEAGRRAYRRRIDDAKERIRARARLNRMQRLGQHGGIYRVEEGDTLAQIAELAYGDAEAWTRIYEANREQIADPAALEVGAVLRIPKRDG